MQKLHDGSKHMANFRYAPQHFNTLMEVSEVCITNLTAIFETLRELKLSGGDSAKWAGRHLQKLFKPKRLLLMALVAELSWVATDYSHRFDNLKDRSNRTVSNIARTGHHLQCLERRLKELFDFRTSKGRPKLPLVLNPSYSTFWLFCEGPGISLPRNP